MKIVDTFNRDLRSYWHIAFECIGGIGVMAFDRPTESLLKGQAINTDRGINRLKKFHS
jgi:hypothetical protein